MPKPKTPPRVDFDDEDVIPSGLFTQQPPSTAQTPVGGESITEKPKVHTEESRFVELPPDVIEPNPYQVRKYFDPLKMQELVTSMRKQGFLSRIWVRKHPEKENRFQLVYGERRWRAASIVVQDTEPRFHTLKCEIVTLDDEKMREIGLIENLQRADLLPLEEAQSFRELLDYYSMNGQKEHSVRKIAERIGKDPSYVQDRLYLLELPSDVQQAYNKNTHIALRALREVCKFPTPELRAPVLELLQEGKLSVANLREVLLSFQTLDEETGTSQESERGRSQNTSYTGQKRRIRDQRPEQSHHSEEQVEEDSSEKDGIRSVSKVNEEEHLNWTEAPSQVSSEVMKVYKALLKKQRTTTIDILHQWKEKLTVMTEPALRTLYRNALVEVQGEIQNLLLLVEEDMSETTPAKD